MRSNKKEAEKFCIFLSHLYGHLICQFQFYKFAEIAIFRIQARCWFFYRGINLRMHTSCLYYIEVQILTKKRKANEIEITKNKNKTRGNCTHDFEKTLKKLFKN